MCLSILGLIPWRTCLLGYQMVQWILPILQDLGFQLYNSPTPIYEEIQTNIYIIKANHSQEELKALLSLFIMFMINIISLLFTISIWIQPFIWIILGLNVPLDLSVNGNYLVITLFFPWWRRFTIVLREFGDLLLPPIFYITYMIMKNIIQVNRLIYTYNN